MTNDELRMTNLTISEARKLLDEKKISSVELTKACLENIKNKNPEINAFITVTEDLALAQARAADEKLKQDKGYRITDNGRSKNDILYPISNTRTSLLGIPIAIKDNICVKDVLCTAGSKILTNFVAPYDATVVTKLKEAGAVILGKTNLDEFGMGSSTETSAYGPTKNPHDLTLVSGGSSGGSAAAVAAGMCLGALGSDTGGSIRQPAYFCGVYGFKPTYGAVSRYGLIAYGSSLDVIGPIAKSVDDLRIIYDVIKGEDSSDSTSLQNSKSKILNPKQITNNKFKTGIINKDVNIPHLDYALATYYIIALAEASSNLSRYDGIKYGLSVQDNDKELLDVYLDSRSAGFGEEVKRRIILGTFVLSHGYFEEYYNKAIKVRELLKKEFDDAFAKFDFLEMPVAPTGPWKIGEKIDDPLQMYLEDIYTVPVNLIGAPALATPENRQIIGRVGSDDLILESFSVISSEVEKSLN